MSGPSPLPPDALPGLVVRLIGRPHAEALWRGCWEAGYSAGFLCGAVATLAAVAVATLAAVASITLARSRP